MLRLYAEAAAEDRRLQLAGYEIYHFGGWRLTAPGGKAPGRLLQGPPGATKKPTL
ncbi:hypothetical protein OG488_00800 [Streptomyces sp. NBC_01460]|uniref:hypothetical protein n=1 Tax=Streptomyces sp. NBC_01460 TaxID=2903875 RepID=UPI002E3273AF|nr:hypothetical protein [Streptomyces sp. NBC_01460]